MKGKHDVQACNTRQPHLASPLPDGFRIEVLVFLAVLAQVAAGEILCDQIDAMAVHVLPAPVAPDDVRMLLRAKPSTKDRQQALPHELVSVASNINRLS